MTVTARAIGSRAGAAWWGRTFLHPAFDYALIGGGLSLVVTALVVARSETVSSIDPLTLATIVLATTAAHFASSTVRLYATPGAYATWPVLTKVLPLVFLGILTLCMAFPRNLGEALTKLYLTWSPYHYAAQTYGLCVMYSYRSGCTLESGEKRALRVLCLLPFLQNFLTAPTIGLEWILPASVFAAAPWLDGLRESLDVGLVSIGLAGPVVFTLLLRRRSSPMPLICPLLMISNGIWWFVLLPEQAFVWATVFHGIQYLAIVIIFHVRDQLAIEGARHGRGYHAVRFYVLSLLLGFCLFQVLPQGFLFAGFGMVESLLLVVAAINIHHFVVDAFIWRLRPGGANRRVVEGAG